MVRVFLDIEPYSYFMEIQKASRDNPLCVFINPRSVDIAASSFLNIKLKPKPVEVSRNEVLIQLYCSRFTDGK